MNTVIIGATSAIATTFARLQAQKPDANLYLMARNQQQLEDLAEDLKARGAASVHIACADMAENNYLSVLERLLENCEKIDLVLMAHGILGDQAQCEKDVMALEQLMQINTLSSMKLLTVLANRLEQQKSGTLAFISSVAGDRGRASNYAYGASKAAVTTFLQGMRVRLLRVGANVVIVKPGFVDTPMTADFDKSGPLWAQPQTIAAGIEKAVEKRKGIVYLPWFWRYIMLIIIHIPGRVFNKLNL